MPFNFFVVIEEETATFEFEKPLEIGEATLFIEFQGQLSDKLNGFYRSKYQWNNEERFKTTEQIFFISVDVYHSGLMC
jgi:uncharacterized GH25 family protein